MSESSSDIYRVFREIAAATGGTAAASANPAVLLRQAAAASEEYYLLYYRPRDYRTDGKFHTIEVAVRRGDLRVSHREGYVAGDAAAGTKTDGAAAAAAKDGAAAAVVPAKVEDIDVAEPLPSKGDPVPGEVLAAAAGYCRALNEASLDFVCREEVKEKLAAWLVGRKAKAVGPPRDGVAVQLAVEDQVRDWVYDYQLARKDGWTAETRTLLEADGQARREERAALETSRFVHKLVVLGPVGLFSAEAQNKHDYVVAQETDADGEPVLVVDVRPKGTEASSLFGKAWVRPRDGAILKIEWEPVSMGNYEAIEAFAKEMRAKPKIRFTSEYAVEKNGLRFPSAYEVVEAYRTSAATFTASRTAVAYKDYKFFEVKVRTEVRRRP